MKRIRHGFVTIIAWLAAAAASPASATSIGPIVSSGTNVLGDSWMFPRSVYAWLARDNEPWIAATDYAWIILPYYEMNKTRLAKRGYIAFDMYRFGDPTILPGSGPIVVSPNDDAVFTSRLVENFARRRQSMPNGPWMPELDIEIVQTDTVGRRLIFAPQRSIGPPQVVLSFDYNQSIQHLSHLIRVYGDRARQSEIYGQHLVMGYFLTSSMVFLASEQELFRTGRRFYSRNRLDQAFGFANMALPNESANVGQWLSFLVIAHEMCHHYRGHTAIGSELGVDQRLALETDADTCAVTLAADWFGAERAPDTVLFLAFLMNQYALYTWSGSELQTTHLPPYERTVELVNRLVSSSGPFPDLDFDPEQIRQTSENIRTLALALEVLREPRLEMTGRGARSDGPIDALLAERMMVDVLRGLNQAIGDDNPDPSSLSRLLVTRARVMISESAFRAPAEAQSMIVQARADLTRASSLIGVQPGSPEYVEIASLLALSQFRDARALSDSDPAAARAASDRGIAGLTTLAQSEFKRNERGQLDRPAFLTRAEWGEIINRLPRNGVEPLSE